MLISLRIRNLALVDDLQLDFRPGYNAVTGETGAGKSLIIGALTLLLGQRADRSLIRAGADAATVEAAFHSAGLPEEFHFTLQECGLEPCEEDQLLLKRTFTSAGANRQFVNGSPATLQTLQLLSGWLVDLHGPHEHQSLLHPARQLALLDDYGSLSSLRSQFTQQLLQHQELRQQKAGLVMDEQAYLRELDLLRFQVAEITSARLDPGEEAELNLLYDRARNAGRIHSLAQSAAKLLHAEEGNLLDQAGTLGRLLHELHQQDPSLQPLLDLHSQSVSAWQELQLELSRYSDRLDLNPEQLQGLEERINSVQDLKRKYGRSIPDILAFAEQAGQRLQTLEQRDESLRALNEQLAALEKTLWKTGALLTAARQKLIPKFSKAVQKELAQLGFKQGGFQIQLRSLPPGSAIDSIPKSGLDTVEFLFAPNPGEPARSLRGIASSGELARVMLALKTVLAAQDQVLLLVFDEVDANVGGETAHAVGRRMQQIGLRHQVLCITHLAPVAAYAAHHYRVEKEVIHGRSLSRIHLLTPEEQTLELSRMLGGQSKAALQHAQALLQEARPEAPPAPSSRS